MNYLLFMFEFNHVKLSWTMDARLKIICRGKSFKFESTPAEKSIILENILTCQGQFYTARIKIASFKSFVAGYIWIKAL